MNPLIIGVIVAVAFVTLLLLFIGMYNTLVRRRIQCDNAWSQIDVQLKRRHDLIPNVVETVKGAASHERGTLEDVVAARTRAVEASGPREQAEAENMLTAALGRLFALAEDYPELRANENFLSLQRELSQTEDTIQGARGEYNEAVRSYETARQTFPTTLAAAAFNFKPREYFELEDPAAREAPKVSFG